MPLNRRQLLGLSPGLLLPRRALADVNERKFLFVFCTGGWDQCYLFAPLYDNSNIDMEPQSTVAELSGITFVDSAEKTNVRSFFQRYGNITCMINGFEARSVAHDICLRLISTGSSLPAHDDWPSIIAAHSQADPLMPFVNLSGPLFTHNFGSSVVRIGSAGQFAELLDGRGIQSDFPAALPSESVEHLEDAWVRDLSFQRLDQAREGREQLLIDAGLKADERLMRLRNENLSLTPDGFNHLASSLSLATDLLAAGASRSVMISYNGVQDLGWDTHAGSFLQAIHFNELFHELENTIQVMHNRNGTSGNPLIDEVTVVVLSEMGRFPQENARGGKEHWTYTSALLMGSGIRGGQTLGGYDEYCFGRPIDLNSGEPYSGGTPLLPGHLGATLLSLADIDYGEFIHDASPINAALR